MLVYVIDYGMGNLISVKRAFEKNGAKVIITDDPSELIKATHIVLPGVGAFSEGMDRLKANKWLPSIRDSISNGTPLLGICLGMQLLATIGHEGGRHEGLDLIEGEVVLLEKTDKSEKIPHVGWNDVNSVGNSILFDNIPEGTDFYFVHSYHFIPKDNSVIISRTNYCNGFVSAIEKGNVYGVQFHPEKSGVAGFQLIRNFLSL